MLLPEIGPVLFQRGKLDAAFMAEPRHVVELGLEMLLLARPGEEERRIEDAQHHGGESGSGSGPGSCSTVSSGASAGGVLSSEA